MQFDWEKILPPWKRSIVIRAGDFFQHLATFLAAYDKRVIHNALLVLFALHFLPRGQPTPKSCAKATVWAMPEPSAALFVQHFSENELESAALRVS